MFDKFSHELYASGSLTADGAGEPSVFVVRDAMVADGEQDRSWLVRFDMDVGVPRMQCSCGMFDHIGMPCRHMLKVLVDTSAMVIPAGNVHKCWTVTAREASTVYHTIGAGGQVAIDTVAGRKNLLYLAAMDLTREGAVTIEGYKASMKALAEVKYALRVMSEDPNQNSPVASVVVDDDAPNAHVDGAEPNNLLAPLKVKACGRPAMLRLKSRADYYGSKRQKTRGIAECYSVDEPEAPEQIGDVARAHGITKRQPKCGLCREVGHNR